MGHTVQGVVTGKPPVIGGSYGREEAPGRSTAIITREALDEYGKDIADATIAIQGFGSVGANAARLLDELGANVVAGADLVEGLVEVLFGKYAFFGEDVRRLAGVLRRYFIFLSYACKGCSY